MLTYINALNLVRLGLHHKTQKIVIEKNSKTQKILILLLNLNIVIGWSNTVNKRGRDAYLIYTNSCLNKQLFTVLKPTKQIYLKLKNLQKLPKKYALHSIYLTTSKGIISINEAIQKKTGGILFFLIK